EFTDGFCLSAQRFVQINHSSTGVGRLTRAFAQLLAFGAELVVEQSYLFAQFGVFALPAFLGEQERFVGITDGLNKWCATFAHLTAQLFLKSLLVLWHSGPPPCVSGTCRERPCNSPDSNS